MVLYVTSCLPACHDAVTPFSISPQHTPAWLPCSSLTPCSHFVTLARSPQEPYAHFTWASRDTIGANPSFTCTVAHGNYSYDYYTGNDNYYVQQQDANYYYINADTNK